MPRKPTREENLFLQNSVGRVINTTLKVLESVGSDDTLEARVDDLVQTNHDDWTELKEAIVRIFNEERNRIFIAVNELPKNKELAEKIAGEVLGVGLAQSTWRENYPEAYTDLLTYKADLIGSVQKKLDEVKS